MTTNNTINGSIKVTTYTSSGTWTKDPRAKFVEAYGFNSGGGGSGRNGTSSSSGGGGGGAGTMSGTSGASGNGVAGEIVVIEYF